MKKNKEKTKKQNEYEGMEISSNFEENVSTETRDYVSKMKMKNRNERSMLKRILLVVQHEKQKFMQHQVHAANLVKP